MALNSYSYLLTLIPVLIGYWWIPAAARRWYLLGLSLLFYASWGAGYTPLPILVCLISFWCGRRMEAREGDSKRWLWTGICLLLFLLSIFKYWPFVLENVNALLRLAGQGGWIGSWRLALPLGISFYTFEAVSYLLDTHQGRARKARFSDIALFVLYWPHLMAGPIVRFRELAPQFSKALTFDLSQFVAGLDRLLIGLAQKNLLANNLAAFVDEGFLPQAAATNSFVDNWALAVAFGLQIYFDFASYSNMAIGVSKMMGIQLPENFRFPYHAASPSDFWARWHMSLSRWIRDYLFFPVNARFGGAPLPLYLSLLGIMSLVGLWHGAGWGFMAWGFLHGLYLVFYRMWERFQENREWAKGAAARWAVQGATLAAVVLAWVPFRADTLEQSVSMLGSMLTWPALQVSYSLNQYLMTALVAAYCVAEPWLAVRVPAAEGSGSFRLWVRPVGYAALLLLFLIFDDRDVQFIYFQF